MKKKEIMEIIKPISGFLPNEKTADCPDSELLAAFVDGTLAEESEKDVRKHLHHCDICASLILSVESRKDRPKKNQPRFGFLWKFWTVTQSFNIKPVPVFAALLAVVLVGVFLVFKFPSVTPRNTHLRNQGQGEIQLISPKGIIPPSSIFFQWDPVPGVRNYILEIRDNELTLVWESSGLLKSKLELPQEILSRLVRKQTYFWRITAVLSNGTDKVSPTLNFSLE